MKRPLLLGTGVALATSAVGIVLVLVIAAVFGDTGEKRAAGTVAKRTGTSTKSLPRRSTTTTTTTTTSSPTGSPAPATVTPPSTAPRPPVVDTTPGPPDPADAYHPVPLPSGLRATITTCSWGPANGGELVAGGTITNVAGTDESWIITAVWLQRNGNQEEDFDDTADLIDLAVGQTIPWHLTVSAPSAPPHLSCALEVE